MRKLSLVTGGFNLYAFLRAVGSADILVGRVGLVGGVEVVLQVLQLNSRDGGVGEVRFLVLRCQEERVFTCRIQAALPPRYCWPWPRWTGRRGRRWGPSRSRRATPGGATRPSWRTSSLE